MINFVGVEIQKLTDTAQIPFHGSDAAAGYDLFADQDYVIQSGASAKISTGIAMAIPDGYWGGIFARSGLATKQGLRPSNCVGVIDAGYRGEVVGKFRTTTDVVPAVFKEGERFAQLVILPVPDVTFTEDSIPVDPDTVNAMSPLL